MTGATAVDVVVRGRVQGVSFRWYAKEQADRLGVTGWVRNEPDGSVAGHFEGDPDAVGRLISWCHDGPRSARVSQVDVVSAAVTGSGDFEITA